MNGMSLFDADFALDLVVVAVLIKLVLIRIQ
jgi:hypothetical protein